MYVACPGDGLRRSSPCFGSIDQERHRHTLDRGRLAKRRKWTHYQFLSQDLGQPDLRDHLLQVIAVMRVSRTWAHSSAILMRPSQGTALRSRCAWKTSTKTSRGAPRAANPAPLP